MRQQLTILSFYLRLKSGQSRLYKVGGIKSVSAGNQFSFLGISALADLLSQKYKVLCFSFYKNDNSFFEGSNVNCEITERI